MKHNQELYLQEALLLVVYSEIAINNNGVKKVTQFNGKTFKFKDIKKFREQCYDELESEFGKHTYNVDDLDYNYNLLFHLQEIKSNE